MKNYTSFIITGILCAGITLLISYGLWGADAKKAVNNKSALALTDAAQKGRDAVVFIMTVSTDTSSFYDEKETGSGVIISDDGFIVTNYHVIAGGRIIQAQLNNNHQYYADLVGIDSAHDVALLKVDMTGLPFLTFGNSDSLLVGEQVIAVGNPLKFHSTVTSGIISANDRILELPNVTIRNFIQTDVPLNYGNSGGALLNARGQLVGLSFAFMSNSGAYEGFSFAIPANLVKKIVDDIKQFGSNQRGFIDMSIQPVDQEIATEAGMSEIFGVVVYAVGADGNADKAGIQSLDILLSLDGKKIISNADLLDRLALYRPGDVLSFEVLRNKKVSVINVTMDRRKE